MRVGIVGSGVSGLSAAWALNEHSQHQVTLFEAGEKVGGHTNTVWFEPEPSVGQAGDKQQGCWVDTGFIVFNEVTYPNFLRFLKHLDIAILQSDMSFSVSRSFAPSLPFFRTNKSDEPSKSQQPSQRGAFEWSGSGPAALFCQLENLLDPSHWRMVWDIIRFNHQSLDTLREAQNGKAVKGNIGNWLDQRGYGDAFRNNYLIPMTACIWSTPPGLAFSAFPALTLLRFMHNHHLLQILDRPVWLTIKGGSKNYVDRILAKLPEAALKVGEEGTVVSAKRDEGTGEWMIKTRNGAEHVFDRVVFACHADQARAILQGTTSKALESTLARFHFNKNVAVLHSDENLMPVRRSAWSAWNFLAVSKDKKSLDEDRVTLTYWMNLLQSLPEEKHGHVLVTLNPSPDSQPALQKIKGSYSYEHPLYTEQSVAAQAQLREMQGVGGAYFAGAWTNYGFHEDGFSSGFRAAIALGAKTPFEASPAEREVPPFNLLIYTLLNLIEKSRAISAPLFALLLAPAIIILTLAIEHVVGLAKVKGERVQRFANVNRNVRMFWEGELQSKWGLLREANERKKAR
ncbi:hypothetical protein CBOM_00477 [Ceraceosorus bombacis]|uniref:Amine oxidase n=1 Tax=Ceraceosorus bombacis TaxID=401625 RepID=A0A0P1BA17_9BASI|nr:hypothetical protein CBOM_00477 [Ceraceosorus bombacis]